MTQQYIVSYELWVSGKMFGWGTIGIEHEGEPKACDMIDKIKEEAATAAGVSQGQLRIVGIFKL